MGILFVSGYENKLLIPVFQGYETARNRPFEVIVRVEFVRCQTVEVVPDERFDQFLVFEDGFLDFHKGLVRYGREELAKRDVGIILFDFLIGLVDETNNEIV